MAELSLLKKIPIFAGCSDEVLQKVASHLKRVMYPSNNFVFKKGDLANRMYLINMGKVAVQSGDGVTFANLTEGSFFGEMGLLYSAPRMASVKTESECEFFELSKEEFEGLKKTSPEIIDRVKQIADARFEWFKKHLREELSGDKSPADFTEEQVNNFRQVFSDVDLDGSGAIDTDELGKLLFKLNGKEFTRPELDAIMQKMDLDINGTIEFEEFLAGLRHLRWLVDDPHQTKSGSVSNNNNSSQSKPSSSSSSSSSSTSSSSCGQCPHKNSKYHHYQIDITEKFLRSLKSNGGFLGDLSEEDVSVLMQFNDMLHRVNSFH